MARQYSGAGDKVNHKWTTDDLFSHQIFKNIREECPFSTKRQARLGTCDQVEAIELRDSWGITAQDGESREERRCGWKNVLHFPAGRSRPEKTRVRSRGTLDRTCQLCVSRFKRSSIYHFDLGNFLILILRSKKRHTSEGWFGKAFPFSSSTRSDGDVVTRKHCIPGFHSFLIV